MCTRSWHSGDLLDRLAVRRLNERMFDRTWAWAGRFRTTEKSIGVAPEDLHVRLKDLLDEGRDWREHGTFPPREFAPRLHHRLLLVHVFANGSGRHARLCANRVQLTTGEPDIDWGAGGLERAGSMGQASVASLRAADGGDDSPLLGLFGVNCGERRGSTAR